MGRLFISRQELEAIFGGHIEMGKFGIFVKDGGNGKLGDWTLWVGEEAIGRPVQKRKKKPEEQKTMDEMEKEARSCVGGRG